MTGSGTTRSKQTAVKHGLSTDFPCCDLQRQTRVKQTLPVLSNKLHAFELFVLICDICICVMSRGLCAVRHVMLRCFVFVCLFCMRLRCLQDGFHNRLVFLLSISLNMYCYVEKMCIALLLKRFILFWVYFSFVYFID